MSIEGVSCVSITWLDWGKKRQAGICVWMPQFNSKLFAKCQPCESILWKINSQEIFLSFLDLSLSKNHLSIYSQNVISHDIIFTHSLFYLMYDLNYTSLQDNFSLEELFLIHKKTLTMMIQSPIGLYQISLKKYLFNSHNEFFIFFESYCLVIIDGIRNYLIFVVIRNLIFYRFIWLTFLIKN